MTVVTALTELAGVRATLVFYESGLRLAASLAAMCDALGNREAAVAREISKAFEECVTGRLSELSARYAYAPPKGEIAIVVAPPGDAAPAADKAIDAALRDALERLPPGKAVAEVAKALNLDRQQLYARAMAMREA